MIGYIYQIGFVLTFAYFLSKLSLSVVDSNKTRRIVKAMVCAMFWFFSIPYLILTGKLFKSQREIDEELFGVYLKAEVDSTIRHLLEENLIAENEVEALRAKMIEEIGTLEEMLDDQTYFSKSIDKEELAGLISYHYYKKNFVFQSSKFDGAERFVLEKVDNLLSLTTLICNKGLNHEKLKTTCKTDRGPFKDILGFHTLDSGLTFLGALSEGDNPFFFIIFYNGLELDLYVPKINNYNKETRSPLGNDEDDQEYFKIAYGEENLVKAKRKALDKLDSNDILDEIKRTVNFAPREGRLPKFGWENIHFETEK